MTLHSPRGASGAHRWMACAGCIKLSIGVPVQPSNVHARRGTACHWLKEQCFPFNPKTKDEPSDFLGCVYDDPEGWSYTFNDEDIEAVEEAVEYLAETSRNIKSAHEIYTEVGFELSDIHHDLFGTGDDVFFTPDLSELVIKDYKNGTGLVEVEENKQLMYYALGAIRWVCKKLDLLDDLEMFGYGGIFKKVTLGIIQPRAYHPDGANREWVPTAKELDDFARDLGIAARKTEAEFPPLEAGDHCKWCPAIAVCPQLEQKTYEIAKQQFSDEPETFALPSPGGMTLEQILKAKKYETFFTQWYKEVNGYLQGLIQSGTPVEGYKIVKSVKHRAWTDKQDAIDTLEMVLEDDEMYGERKLKTPAQIEKALKKHKSLVGQLAHKPEGHNILVPNSDPRAEIACNPEAIFDEIEEEI